jgi:hypothetical protein
MSVAKVNPATHTWPIPYPKLRSAAAAYPGTMVVYAAIPTTGLDSPTATKLATFLTYAVGAGQTPGQDIGQLPSGFLPLTAADGLAALVAYTKQAAQLVAAQHGNSAVTPPGSTGGDSGGPGSSPTLVYPTPPRQAEPSASPYIPPVDEPVGYTAAVRSTTAAWALPVAILISVAFTVIAIVVRTAAGMSSAATMRRRLERLNQAKDRS